MGVAGPYTGDAIDNPDDKDCGCPGVNPNVRGYKPPSHVEPCHTPNNVIGSYTLTAEPLAPLGYSNQPEVFGQASVTVVTAGLDPAQPCPDPCLTCGFTAIYLEHEVSQDNWEKVGTPVPEFYEGKQVGLIWPIYNSPGTGDGSGVYRTQRAMGDPKAPDWDPDYQDGGWSAEVGRRYRTCVQLVDAWEGDAPTSGYECGPARLYPDQFPLSVPPPPFELAIDPLALFFGAESKYYIAINLPRPPTTDVLRAQVEEQIAAMTPTERRQARERVEELRTYLEAIEQGLENA